MKKFTPLSFGYLLVHGRLTSLNTETTTVALQNMIATLIPGVFRAQNRPGSTFRIQCSSCNADATLGTPFFGFGALLCISLPAFPRFSGSKTSGMHFPETLVPFFSTIAFFGAIFRARPKNQKTPNFPDIFRTFFQSFFCKKCYFRANSGSIWFKKSMQKYFGATLRCFQDSD